MNLTTKNKQFCEEFLSNGMNITKAYMDVYGTTDYNAAAACGSRMLKKDKIQEYLNYLRKDTMERLRISREEIIEDLIDIKNSNKTTSPSNSLKSIEILNKMLGFNEPDKHDLDIKGDPIVINVIKKD